MKAISLEAVVAITELSKRTWWRRIAEHRVHRLPNDAAGRTQLMFEDINMFICTALDHDEKELLLLADSGHAQAQNEVGLLFLAAGKSKVAVYWLRTSADQGEPDAMQHLGQCYAAGDGVSKDINLSLMWISRAAACGHAVASSQIAGLLPFHESR